ncbi:MAG: hypothetical protein N4A76_06055 [Firmicutes bacterium]|jgi:hypothetical protein|nr:hypothetical protein [Bacillota bacterium]
MKEYGEYMGLSKMIIGYIILIPAVYIVAYALYDTGKEVRKEMKASRKSRDTKKRSTNK